VTLREWAEIFIRHRDLAQKRLSSLEPSPRGFVLTYKDGSRKEVLVQDHLSSSSLSSDVVMVVCLNTSENVGVLTRDWKVFSSYPDLVVVFAHPAANEKWLVKPWLHSRVADESSLAQGLRALHESIRVVPS